MTTTPVDDDTTAVVIAGIVQFLCLIHAVADTNPRDFRRALEDKLLEMRGSVKAGSR